MPYPVVGIYNSYWFIKDSNKPGVFFLIHIYPPKLYLCTVNLNICIHVRTIANI